MKNLVFIILLLLIIVSSTQVIGIFNSYYFMLDEILVVVLFGLFLFLFSRREISINKNYISIMFFITVLLIINFIYGFYAIKAHFFKLIYYIKSILPFVFIPYLVRYSFDKKKYKLIINILLIIAVFGIIEFILVQFVDTFYFGREYPLKFRGHIYRAASVVGHPISFGMLSFISFVFAHTQKYKKIYLLIFIVAIILTGSRVPLVLTIIYLIYHYWKFKIKLSNNVIINTKYIVLLLFPFLLLSTIYLPTYFSERKESTTIRSVAISNGIKNFKNPINIIIGSGIGSYGMHWSVEDKSEVYKNISFPKRYLDILIKNKSSGMESFLIMIMVEFGILGTLFLLALITHLTHKRVSTFKIYLIFTILISSVLYPLYTLPFVFLLNIFFPYFDKPLCLKKN